MELTSQSVHAVCEGAQAPHCKIETFCHGAQAVSVLNQDKILPGMIPLEWSQAQSKDPALCQIIEAIQKEIIGKLKIKKDMTLGLKAFLRVSKQAIEIKMGNIIKEIPLITAEPGFN